MEYGYWIGSIGILGFIGLAILFRILYTDHKVVRQYFLTFLLMSFGNSLFYGLLTGVMALNIIIILTSLDMKYQKRQYHN